MYNRGKIILGILIFVALAAFPFYSNLGKISAKPEPEINTPEIQAMTEKHCIEPKDYMKSEHMKILNEWRDSVVRDGNRIYVGAGGIEYNISLQNTCMKCHSNKKNFCDKCHTYAGVKPYCWDCHLAPKESGI